MYAIQKQCFISLNILNIKDLKILFILNIHAIFVQINENRILHEICKIYEA
jgi:hypothetical protein